MSDASGNTVKPANKRGTARLAAVQALYQMDVGGTSLTKVVVEYESERLGKEIDGHEYREADPSYFKAILAGVVADQKEIDPQIHQSLPSDWPLTRVDTTLRAILRCGVWELAERKDVPARVIINEYIDIAKAFFEVREPKLVNGVLNKVARDVRPDEFEQDEPAQDETSSDDKS